MYVCVLSHPPAQLQAIWISCLQILTINHAEFKHNANRSWTWGIVSRVGNILSIIIPVSCTALFHPAYPVQLASQPISVTHLPFLPLLFLFVNSLCSLSTCPDGFLDYQTPSLKTRTSNPDLDSIPCCGFSDFNPACTTLSLSDPYCLPRIA